MTETNTEKEEYYFAPACNKHNTRRPTLTLDVEYYQNLLDDDEIPQHQKEALVETCWAIITSVIGFGFGVHPLQKVEAPEMRHAKEAISKLLSDDVEDQRIQQQTNSEVRKNQKGKLSEQFKLK